MTALRLQVSKVLWSANAGGSFLLGQEAFRWRLQWSNRRKYATDKASQPSAKRTEENVSSKERNGSSDSHSSSTSSSATSSSSSYKSNLDSESSDKSIPSGWEDDTDFDISKFSQLPYKDFGVNQHMIINAEFKECLRQVLWQFKAPIRYAFAYGSGVFPQTFSESKNTESVSPHPQAPEAVVKWQNSGGKVIDFIFGVSYTQHWHDINIQQHRNHYSFLGSLGSGLVSKIQDNFGAGAYFNPYVTVNGLMIKYGVLNLDTIYRDLSDWETLYVAGRLQKPVKILRDDPRIRLANQVNLISALRSALLMLPSQFTERDLYAKIAGISYMGDPRNAFKAENPDKVANIVDSQMTNFRQLYSPLVMDLPNVQYNDPDCSKKDWSLSPEYNCRMEQDMDPQKRGNMVRRLPKSFRKKIYNSYRGVFHVPESEYEGLVHDTADEDAFLQRGGGNFDQKIADDKNLENIVSEAIKQTVTRPAIGQTAKGIFTAGVRKGWKYYSEKRAKGRIQQKEKMNALAEEQSDDKGEVRGNDKEK